MMYIVAGILIGIVFILKELRKIKATIKEEAKDLYQKLQDLEDGAKQL